MMITRREERSQPASLDKLLVHLRGSLHITEAETLRAIINQAIEQVQEMRTYRDRWKKGKRRRKPSGAEEAPPWATAAERRSAVGVAARKKKAALAARLPASAE